MIGKAEALPPTVAGGQPKANHRFIVTSLPARTHPARELYEKVYCARGDAENRVKEHKLGLFSARCSSNLFGANTLRFYLSTFAMILFRALREALAGTRLAVASAGRIRLRLLKIGALVRISVRRVHLALSSPVPTRTCSASPGTASTPPEAPTRSRTPRRGARVPAGRSPPLNRPSQPPSGCSCAPGLPPHPFRLLSAPPTHLKCRAARTV